MSKRQDGASGFHPELPKLPRAIRHQPVFETALHAQLATRFATEHSLSGREHGSPNTPCQQAITSLRPAVAIFGRLIAVSGA